MVTSNSVEKKGKNQPDEFNADELPFVWAYLHIHQAAQGTGMLENQIYYPLAHIFWGEWKVDFQSIKPLFGRVYSSWKKGKMIYITYLTLGYSTTTIRDFNLKQLSTSIDRYIGF